MFNLRYKTEKIVLIPIIIKKLATDIYFRDFRVHLVKHLSQ